MSLICNYACCSHFTNKSNACIKSAFFNYNNFVFVVMIRLTVVYKHHNNTIRLTIQHKAALTTCVYR